MSEYGHRTNQGDGRITPAKRRKDPSNVGNARALPAEACRHRAFEKTGSMNSFNAGPGKGARGVRRGCCGGKLAGYFRQIDGAIRHFASASLKQRGMPSRGAHRAMADLRWHNPSGVCWCL
jgi:hypothetical protein